MGNSASSPSSPQQKILLAVDDSSNSADTCTWAAKTLLNRGHQVLLVQVVDSSPASQADYHSGEGGLLPSGKAVADPAVLESSKAYLAKMRDTLLAEAGVKPSNVTLVPLPSNTATSGDIGRTISNFAAEQKCDGVVIGSRGLGAFRRRMLGLVGLGSVSDYVAHHAPCTVFIHRAP